MDEEDFVSTRVAALSMDVDTDGGVVAELSSRHGSSAQPQSKQVMAVLQAVLDVLQAEGMPRTPTTMFGAVMAALDKPETQSSAQACLALCTVLSATLARVPNGVLRGRFVSGVAILMAVVQRHNQEAATLKAGLRCLSQVLCAMDPTNWPAAAAAWALLLSFTTDARPKVRKGAAAGAVEVLGGVQHTPAVKPASEAILALCARVLPGPSVAARAAAAAPSKQRGAYEAAITTAVADVLHLLGALRGLAPLMAGSTLPPLLDLLLKLLPLRQLLLSQHALDVVTCVVAARSCPLSAAQLASLLDSALQAEALLDRRTPDALLALARLLVEGLTALAVGDAPAAAPRVASTAHLLVQLLGGEQDGVRLAASQALQRLMREVLSDSLLAAASTAPRGQALSPLQSIVAAVASSLGARYQEAWPLALPVVGALLESLGPCHSTLAAPLLEQLGGLCSGAFAAGEDDAAASAAAAAAPGPSSSAAALAEANLGIAIRCLGPEVVLSVLPLNLQQGLEGTGTARTWLLPLLRRHVQGAHLRYWAQELQPLARQLGVHAASASAAGRKSLALSCHTLELQIWASLPAFCNWPRDAATAYPACVQELAAAVQGREDLQPAVCSALVRLALQARSTLVCAGDASLGFADPVVGAFGGVGGGSGGATGDDDDDEGAAAATISRLEAGDGAGAPPPWFTSEMAAANVAALRQYSRNWLVLLFRLFLAGPPEQRAPLGAAIAAIAAITDPALTASLFRSAITKLLRLMTPAGGDAADEAPPVLEGGTTDPQRIASFLELCLALGAGLDDGALTALWAAAQPQLLAPEPLLQKKGYKVAAYLVETRPAWRDAHLAALLSALLAAGPAAACAAKRFRLRCLQPLLVLMRSRDCPPLAGLVDDDGRELVPGGAAAAAAADGAARALAVAGMLVAELVLATKEANTKTRTAAYQALVTTAHALDASAAESEVTDAGAATGDGLMSLVHMVAAGLVGSTPHMMSASVMALARLLFEFGGALEHVMPQLLPACVLLLRSRSREVIKSVLGLLKVAAMRLPPDMLTPQLPSVLEGVLLWVGDSRNKFKLKVRRLLERLARRCGMDAVAAALPPEHAKLLTHIRKAGARKARVRASTHAGSEAGESAQDARSVHSAISRGSMARTARRSEWAHTAVFSSEDGGSSGHQEGSRGAPRSRARAGRLHDSGAEPMDLLDPGSSRQLARSAAGMGRPRVAAAGDDFTREATSGRMVIRDEEAEATAKALRKRKRGPDGYDSDDSDMDDLRGVVGLDAAMRAAARSVRFAPSVATSAGAKSLGGASTGSKASARSAGAASRGGGGGAHSGERFKPKRAGGDVKSKGGVEPYAYWKLDRKMLNRRRGKQADATKSLGKVVTAAKAGAAKGSKAKRAASNKRARR